MEKTRFNLQPDMKKSLGLFSVVIIVYIILTLLAPEAETVNRYELTIAQTQLLRISFILPLLLIWLTALLSVTWFRRYTALIKGSQEESAFHKITLGLWMLLLVLLVPSFISVVTNFYPSDLVMQKGSIILRNYVTIAFYLTAFWYLWQASKDLLQTVHTPEFNTWYQNLVVGILSGLAVVYTWAVLTNPFRTVSTDPLVKATYYLPDFLIVFTVIIPYVLIWIMGTNAALNVLSYSKRVPGIIYRQTFSYLAFGLSFTVGLLIFLQFLSQANASLSHVAFRVIILIIYLLLFAIAAGYILIARGARKLSVIEEVK
jgi:hypothetical protein